MTWLFERFVMQIIYNQELSITIKFKSSCISTFFDVILAYSTRLGYIEASKALLSSFGFMQMLKESM